MDQNHPPRNKWAGFKWCDTAVFAWGILLLVVCVRGLLQDIHLHSVYDDYLEAGKHWRAASNDLYGPLALHFRYSPLFAAFFALFTFLPDRIGSVLWRLINAGVFLAGLCWWLRRVLPASWDKNRRGIFFLLVLPLSAESLNNAQANPLMAGLLLFALVSVRERRWNYAVIFLTGAFFLKLYPFALGLLLVLLYPKQLIWRQLLAVAGGLGICFLLQSPDYVARQFMHWFHYLQGDFRFDWPMDVGYRDLHLLLSVLRIPVSQPAYVAIQLLGAVLAAGLCFLARNAPRPDLMKFVYSLGCCWILLLGPSTESCTFILLAPALAWQLIDAWTAPRPQTYRRALLVVCALFGMTMIGGWFSFANKIHALGLHPLATLIFLCCVLYEAKQQGALAKP